MINTERRLYADPHTGRTHDPLVALRDIVVRSEGKINDLLSVSRGPDVLEAAKAEQFVVNLVRGTFDMPRWDGEAGYTDAEVLETLDHFNRWLVGKGYRASN